MPKPVQQHSSKAVERFVFFSDAVFAFALTLLASKLRVPDHSKFGSNAQIIHWLGAQAPGFGVYVLGFMLVATLWVRHHRLFELLQNYDRWLIVLNFILLFCVSLVPFSLDVFNAAPRLMASLAIYIGVLTVNGFAFFGVWAYTRLRQGLLSSETRSRALFRTELIDYLGLPLIAGAILAALLILGPRSFDWFPMVLVIIYMPIRKAIRRRIGVTPSTPASEAPAPVETPPASPVRTLGSK